MSFFSIEGIESSKKRVQGELKSAIELHEQYSKEGEAYEYKKETCQSLLDAAMADLFEHIGANPSEAIRRPPDVASKPEASKTIPRKSTSEANTSYSVPVKSETPFGSTQTQKNSVVLDQKGPSLASEVKMSRKDLFEAISKCQIDEESQAKLIAYIQKVSIKRLKIVFRIPTQAHVHGLNSEHATNVLRALAYGKFHLRADFRKRVTTDFEVKSCLNCRGAIKIAHKLQEMQNRIIVLLDIQA